jgi:hypothetical protein
MALHLRGGREHPQVLTGQIVVGTIVEGYFQYVGLAVQIQFSGYGFGHLENLFKV